MAQKMDSNQRSAQIQNKFSALISFIKKESIEEIKQVLHKWTNLLSLKDQSGRTALHYCSEHTSALCADLLLEKCPNLLTSQDNEGYTALHLSVISGNQLMTRYLISKSDANYVNQCDFESHSAIHWATVCGQLQCLDLLLNSGAHSSRADIHGAFPLHYSAQMCNPHSGICVGNDSSIGLSVLNRLLQCPEVDVNCVDSDDRTPLLWAASAGSAEAIIVLINAGANVAAKDKDGLTALHCASSRGHIDCVETLLNLCGADINQMDANGCPPLFYAVTLGHADCTRLLIESGADVNTQDFKGRTAAHCGAARGQFETIKILGQQGANLWLRNSRGDLPLHEAIKSGRKELVKWLLDQIPTAVNATNSYGRSALHIAAINNNIEMCKILIDVGADVNTVMKTKGHFITPLDAALQKGYRGVAKYLLLHGALPASRISHNINKTSNQRCPSGRPLDTAFENNDPIDTYDEWRARSRNTDSTLHSQSHLHPTETTRTSQTPKLPTLVKNIADDQHIRETSSSSPSSLLDNTNHYKNIREFETPLIDKPSTLKQAIITNVYVTNTPIVHSKRVPPLKKMKKKRKTIMENDDQKGLKVYTPSMSSSSSVVNGEDNIEVVLETKDDSDFKLNGYQSDEEFDERDNDLKVSETMDQKVGESKSEDMITKQYLETNEEIDEKVSDNEEIDSKPNAMENEKSLKSDERHEKEVMTTERDEELKEIDSQTKNIETKDQMKDSEKNVDNNDHKIETISQKSAKSAEISDKNQSSAKSIERPKRSVSRRRSSVVDPKTVQTIEKKADVQQKSVGKKTIDSKKTKTVDNSEKSSVTSTKIKARKDFEEKSKHLSETIENETKGLTKRKARKDFEEKSKQLSETIENETKGLTKRKARKDFEEKSKQLSETIEIESKDLTKRKARKEFSEKLNKLSEKVSDRSGKQSSSSASQKNGHKVDKKDIDSITYIKSDNVSDKSSLSSGKDKSDKSLQKDKELNEQEVVATDPNAVTSEKSHKAMNEDKGEYDEYFDQWESDSEKTVIDSQVDQKSVRDINSRKSSLISEGQKSRKSIESKQSLKSNQSKAKSISDNKKPINGKIVEKDIQKRETKQTKPSVDRKTSDKSQTQSEKSVKSTKSSKTSDKSTEKKVSNPMAAKRPSISRGKTIKDNIQSDKTSTKSSKVAKVKSKIDEIETIIKSSDSLQKKSYLSTSDMSLDKSSTQRNEMRSSPMKTSISNQEINELDDNKDKIVTNVSSEESIFDSALVMADMERDDTRMYSDIERMAATEGTASSLDRIQRNSDSSTGEQLEVCNEYQCNTHHKPESRCSHKLHFKTLPAHLGKVEVAHIGSRVDSRRDTNYPTDNRYNRSRVRVVRTVRPSFDGFKSVDPNFITQTVEKSLRKYQLERKLFEELHELKRFQIRSGRSNEVLMVKRLVDKFRRDVKAPGMTDFTGPYTYKNYEFYLYDQLRRLSTSNEGKVALLTRSVSHENIQLIRNSNERYITQSSPEIMQNREGLDTNQNNFMETHEIHTKSYQNLFDINVKQNVSQNNENNVSTEEEVIEIVERKTIFDSFESQTFVDNIVQTDDSSHVHQITSNFDDEPQICSTESEQKLEDQNNSDQNFKDLTQNISDYEKSQIIIISENIENTEDVTQLLIDTNEEHKQSFKSKFQIIESIEEIENIISERDDQKVITDQRDGPSIDQNSSLAQKIDQISEIQTNIILNEALNEQMKISLETESDLQKQTKTGKPKSQASVESNESQATDQISDAKSTYASLNSSKYDKRSQYSNPSRKTSSKSVNRKTVDKRKAKEKESFKKECLKPVRDLEPSVRAKNRKQFKRRKSQIPPKFVINISIEEIRNRWKDIKEKEMKKVFILSSHKQNELSSGYTLWFELNKKFRNKNTSFDSQIDRYITENRTGLQRTHSDSYLNRHKSDIITSDKSIK